jgi:hypothetical protein
MSVKLQSQSVRLSIERSGTGRSCPGLVVEKSGTGIDVEKSGTGIDVEKSGTGRKLWTFAGFLALLALVSPAIASDFSLGLTSHHHEKALVARGGDQVLVGSAEGMDGYALIPIYSVPVAGLQSEGSGSGTSSEGSGSGTSSEGSGSGTSSEGSGSGTSGSASCSLISSEGSGSGTSSEGSGSGTSSEGSGSGTSSEGSGSGTSEENCASGGSAQLVFWGYAEVVLTSARQADIILYRDHQGQLVEDSVHADVGF